ncbi:MAG: M81 family metallopeptidase [Deltaproteobacteria bacterium]|nr:M81 family metallopeptidase [Deltaproteobacteria bacterium]
MTSIKMSLGRGGRPLRIGYGRIFHEGCADSPVPTTQEDFLRMHHLEGEELARACDLRGTELKSFFPHAELTGFVQAARAAGNVEAVPLSSSLAVPSGPVTRECFEWLLERLLARLAEAGPLDGIYLALHGSMDVQDLGEAPEALIVRRVREAVGPGPRIAASFDLHGNMTPGLVDALDLLVAYRTNPHWDLAPTGYRAGNRLIRALRGQVTLTKAWRKLPVVLGGGTTIDFVAPMRKVFAAMRTMERDPRVLATSLFMVHPFTSSKELGWSVHVLTDGDEALASRLADELADLAWQAAETPLPDFHSIDDALDRAGQSTWRHLGPVTLVDVDDIVGAGAPGGSTQILEALTRRPRALTALVPIHDPALYQRLASEPLGTTHDVMVCGTPGYDQPPVSVRGTLTAKADTELGRRVLLVVGDVHVAISEAPPLPIHPRYWAELGVDVRRADVMVQKNFFHYRIFHVAYSFQHLPVVSRGATSIRKVLERPFRVPMRPVAVLGDWREGDRALRS